MIKLLPFITFSITLLLTYYLFSEYLHNIQEMLLTHIFIIPNSNIILVATFIVVTILIFIFIYDTKIVEKIFFLLYASSSIALTISQDLILLIIFYEFMAILGIIILFFSCDSQKIILRYSVVHLLSGTLLLVGACLQIDSSIHLSHDVINIDSIKNNTIEIFPKLLIFVALLINCAATPFSGWLLESYSNTSKYGTLILSTFTTKTSLYILLKLFYGSNILIILGFIGSIYSIIASVFENHIKRLVCYNLLGQISFIIIAIGINSSITQGAVSLHIIMSLLYNCLFLMSITEITKLTGKHYLQELGNLFKQIPLESIGLLIAILATLPFPFIGTFISKSLIKLSITASSQNSILISKFFYLSAPILFTFSGLKIFWLACIVNNKQDFKLRKSNKVKQYIIMLLSALCITSAIFYKSYVSFFVDDTINFNPYNQFDIVVSLLYLVSALLFVSYFSKRQSQNTTYNKIDLLYKLSIQHIILFIVNFVLNIRDILTIIANYALQKIVTLSKKLTKAFCCNSIRITVLLLMIFIGLTLCLSL